MRSIRQRSAQDGRSPAQRARTPQAYAESYTPQADLERRIRKGPLFCYRTMDSSL